MVDPRDLATAKEIVSIAKTLTDDLPDGMADEILEAWDMYLESKKAGDNIDEARTSLVYDIKEVCEDWGFPFG